LTVNSESSGLPNRGLSVISIYGVPNKQTAPYISVMPGPGENSIEARLQIKEYNQLLERGYLGIKIYLPPHELKMFQASYKKGSSFIFYSPSGQVVKTIVTNIDAGEDYKGLCKVFVGFTLA
jgi:hypothetical protein